MKIKMDDSTVVEVDSCNQKQYEDYNDKKNNLVIAQDADGNKFVIIPQIIFKGKRSISWDQVEKYLMQYIGKIFEISETKDFVAIDKAFIDEYTGSVYTRKLVGALPKVKANISQGIPELIEIATDRRWKEDFENKHKKKAENGWYRYNTRFAMPITNGKGEIIEYNMYQAVLIVRYSADKKLYLYDIQNIKKKRDTHHG